VGIIEIINMKIPIFSKQNKEAEPSSNHEPEEISPQIFFQRAAAIGGRYELLLTYASGLLPANYDAFNKHTEIMQVLAEELKGSGLKIDEVNDYLAKNDPTHSRVNEEYARILRELGVE